MFFLRPDGLVLRSLARHVDAFFVALGTPVPVRRPGSEGIVSVPRVLDFGCGSRPYERAALGRGLLYVPCDLTEGGAHVTVEIGAPLPFPDQSFEAVLSTQVLEHVWDLDWYLGECARILGPEGRLFLSTHGVWLFHPHPTDFRRWTRQGLERELDERGFEVISSAGVLGPLAWTTLFRSLGFCVLLRSIPGVGPILQALLALFMNARILLEDALTPRHLKLEHACVYAVVCRKKESSSPEMPCTLGDTRTGHGA